MKFHSTKLALMNKFGGITFLLLVLPQAGRMLYVNMLQFLYHIGCLSSNSHLEQFEGMWEQDRGEH
jgi:hypothetical protein